MEDTSNQIQLSAWSVKDLDIPKINYDMNAIKRKNTHLQDIEFPKVKSDKVTVLISTNHADLLVHREYRTGKDGEPVAVKTALGWLIVGGTKLNKLNTNCNVINSNDVDVRNENMKRFWSIDSYGINPKLQLLTPGENRALTILENTTTF